MSVAGALLLGAVLLQDPADSGRLQDAYGDPLPPGAIARLGSARLLHGGMVLAVEYSPQGNLLASGAWDGSVCLWAADSGAPLRRFSIGASAHKPWLSIAFSPDGKSVAARGGNELRLWSCLTGEMIRSWPSAGEGEAALAFSPDGKEIALLATRGALQRFDLASGKEIGADAPAPAEADGGFPVLAYAPDGKTLAMGEGKTVRLRERSSGQELRRFTGHGARVTSVVFSPDGLLLATGSQDGSLRLWESASAEELLALPGYQSGRIQVAFSPDGRTLASAQAPELSLQLLFTRDALGKERELHLWEVATGKKKATLKQPDPGSVAFSISPDGLRLAMAGRHSVHLWNLAQRQEIPVGPGHRTCVSAVAFSPDGKTIATAADVDLTYRVWAAAGGRELGDLKGSLPYQGPPQLAYFPDGKTLAQANAPVQLWDPATESELHWHSARDRKDFLNGRAFAFSRDGRLLATTLPGGTLQIRALDTGRRILTLKGESLSVARVALSDDGKTLAAGYVDDSVRLWDLASARVRWTNTLGTYPPPADANTERGARVSFLPGGKAVAAWHGGKISVWDAASGRILQELEGDWSDAWALTLSPDGKLIAGWKKGCLELWETETGGEFFTDPGDETRWRWSATGSREAGEELFSFSPDGKMLVSAAGGVAHVWDLVGGGLPAKALSDVELGECWTGLGDKDVRKAREAMQKLARSGIPAVAFLRSRLLPSSAIPRENLKTLLADLSSEDIGTRERASRELRERGTKENIEVLLAAGPSSEAQARLMDILFDWSRPFSLSGEGLRTSRAIQVLGGIGTREAEEALGELAGRLRLTREREDASRARSRLLAAQVTKPASK